jgi:hypothetical protein
VNVLSHMIGPGADGRVAAVLSLLVAAMASAALCAQSQPPAAPPPSAPAATSSEPAQGPDQSPALPSDPDRIRRALARPATLLPAATTLEVDGTTFRVSVTQKPFNIWSYWGPPDTHVSSNVRTWYFSNWHAEYLRMVTPEAGRRAALYPTGMVPIMPAVSAITQAIEEALNRRAKRKAKEEVERALEAFFAEHPEARVPAPSAPDKTPVP